MSKQVPINDESNRLLKVASPIFLKHVIKPGANFPGFGWAALIDLVDIYDVRTFAMTTGFHRYFSHR